MARVAVQVILYKSSALLEPLLRSLREQTFRDFEVWFYENSTDQAEADRAESIIRASTLPYHFVRGEQNIGFSGGHQALYLKHNAPYIFLLNHDAELAPEHLAHVVERMESDSQIGSVTGLAYRTREEPFVIDTAGFEYKNLGMIVDRFAGQYVFDALPASEVFGVSGAVALYRRSAVEKAGGLFDPHWFMYKEDVDLALRLRRAGYTAWFEPKAIAYHSRGVKEERKGVFARLADERRRPAVLRKASYVNQWRVYARHWEQASWRDRLWTIKAEVLRSALVFLASPNVFLRSWSVILTSVIFVKEHPTK